MKKLFRSYYLWFYKFFNMDKLKCHGFCPNCDYIDICLFENDI